MPLKLLGMNRVHISCSTNNSVSSKVWLLHLKITVGDGGEERLGGGGG